MNNSFIALEPSVDSDVVPKLREEESKLIRIIEAIQEVTKTGAWSTLKSEVFDGLVVSLERDLRAEAKKEDPDSKRLNRLSGELKWAEKYSDLSKLANTYMLQLQRIRNKQQNADSKLGDAQAEAG